MVDFKSAIKYTVYWGSWFQPHKGNSTCAHLHVRVGEGAS